MELAKPRIVALDTSTLGVVARDYFSQDAASRDKARRFVTELQEQCVFVAFAITHVSELLRHDNTSVVGSRLAFLRLLPHIAWLRPYNRTWFPGSPFDLHVRELHAFANTGARTWAEIVDAVRPDLWETGCGHEMFVEDQDLWDLFRIVAQTHQEHEQYVSSVARVDHNDVEQLTLGEAATLAVRSQEERRQHMPHMVSQMTMQLDLHGDKRLKNTYGVAAQFTQRTLERLDQMELSGHDLANQIIDSAGIPQELLTSKTTVGQIGELGVYARHLKSFCSRVYPRIAADMRRIPVGTLPGYVLGRRLAAIQRKATRVSGSDLGDGHLAVMSLYADAVQVDKRTHEYLSQIRNDDPQFANLMNHVIRVSDYSDIPQLVSGI